MEVKTQTQTMMEELEERRKKLKESTAEFKSAIEDQVEVLKETAIKWSIRGVIAVGFSVVSFYLIKRITRKPKPESKLNNANGALVAESSSPNPIVTSIKVYIATFLLGLAREFIIRYLENAFSNSQPDEPIHTQPAKSQPSIR